MGYYRMQIKKVTFNNETFTLINDSPSTYNNEQWHHLEIVYKGVVLVKLQSPSRKLFYEALRRCILTCAYAEVWPETIWVNMDIPGKYEAWERSNQESMETGRLKEEARIEAIPHYLPTLPELIRDNQNDLESDFRSVINEELGQYNNKTDKELDKSMDFAINNLDIRMYRAKTLMIQAIYYWMKERGLFDNPSTT